VNAAFVTDHECIFACCLGVCAGNKFPFGKPKDPSIPTRHLYCCNCPPLLEGADWKHHELVRFCGDYGLVEDYFTVSGKPWAVVSFADTAGASAAMQALQDRPLLGRAVHVQYADKLSTKNEHAAPSTLVCTSASPHVTIDGLVLAQDFLSAAEEAAVLAALDSLPWHAQMSRRVQHYGFTFDYTTRKCSTPATPLPACLDTMIAHAMSLGLLATRPDQCTVNEYLPGQGIRSHVDTHSAFHDGLMSVSLGAPVVMDFKGDFQGAACVKAVLLPPRSALVMHGAARYAWQHGIASRKSDMIEGKTVPRARRVSITFRAVRHLASGCACAFPQHCDSQQGSIPESRRDWEGAYNAEGGSGDEAGGLCSDQGGGSERCSARGKVAGPIRVPSHEGVEGPAIESPEIERVHVHRVYDAIASHFRSLHPPQALGHLALPERLELIGAVSRVLAPFAAVRTPLQTALANALPEQTRDGVFHTPLSATRYKPWPKVAAFLAGLPAGSIVADIGCGNGKYMYDPRHFIVGTDRSAPLAHIAATRAAHAGSICIGDATYVALRSGVFDAAISIAVLHHLSTPQRRVKALRELARIVRPGGRILVYAWAQEQGPESRFAFTAPDELVPWTAMHLPPASAAGGETGGGGEVSGGQGEWGGGYVGGGRGDAAAHGEALLRYCHLYQHGELTALSAEVEGVVVEEESWDCSNCCITLRRL
jgi:alkylated DNA repair dioxygenase AlkB/SAM-dependent methyltransferase